jgi:hypothetical protein
VALLRNIRESFQFRRQFVLAHPGSSQRYYLQGRLVWWWWLCVFGSGLLFEHGNSHRCALHLSLTRIFSLARSGVQSLNALRLLSQLPVEVAAEVFPHEDPTHVVREK